MNYTKGEWKVVGFLGEHDEMGAVIKSGGKLIAHTAGGLRYHSKPEEWGEYHANAHLIVAAPLMYETLKAIRNLCDGYTELDKGTCSLYITKILAKAEGK